MIMNDDIRMNINDFNRLFFSMRSSTILTFLISIWGKRNLCWLRAWILAVCNSVIRFSLSNEHNHDEVLDSYYGRLNLFDVNFEKLVIGIVLIENNEHSTSRTIKIFNVMTIKTRVISNPIVVSKISQLSCEFPFPYFHVN